MLRTECDRDAPPVAPLTTLIYETTTYLFESAAEVLVANGVEIMIAKGGEFTPTPVISHAILSYNRQRNWLLCRSHRPQPPAVHNGRLF